MRRAPAQHSLFERPILGEATGRLLDLSGMALMPSRDPRVEREARVLAEYLIAGAARPEVIERYHLACEARGLLPVDAEDAVLRSIREHPWLVAPLEAACVWVAPEHALRKKILLMLAVLETVPALSDHFLPLGPPDRSRLIEILRLLALGARAVGKTCLGLVLWRWLGRTAAPDG